MFSCRTNELKLECLKYLGRIKELKSATFLIMILSPKWLQEQTSAKSFVEKISKILLMKTGTSRPSLLSESPWWLLLNIRGSCGSAIPVFRSGGGVVERLLLVRCLRGESL